MAGDGKASVTFVDHQKVAEGLMKGAGLASGPDYSVSALRRVLPRVRPGRVLTVGSAPLPASPNKVHASIANKAAVRMEMDATLLACLR